MVTGLKNVDNFAGEELTCNMIYLIRQQDAHEFLTDLLNLIQEEMTANILQLLENLGVKDTQLPLHVQAPREAFVDRTAEVLLIGSKRPLARDDTSSAKKKRFDSSYSPTDANENARKAAERLSLISHHFESTVQNTFSCLSCGYRRQPKQETYRVFSIDIEYQKDNVANSSPALSASSSAQKDLNASAVSTPVHNNFSSTSPNRTMRDIMSASTESCDSNCNNNSNIFNTNSAAAKGATKAASSMNLNLQVLFGNFFNDEIRDLVCEKCGQADGKVKITSQIVTLPQTLVIHLKRFRYEESSQTYVKINTAISFPLSLNLLQCGECIKNRDIMTSQALFRDMWNQKPGEIQTSAADFEAFFPSPEKVSRRAMEAVEGAADGHDNNDSFYSYSLCAVVRHIGREMLTGHYICDAYDDAAVDGDGRQVAAWKRFDDAHVTEIDKVCSSSFLSFTLSNIVCAVPGFGYS